MKRLFWRIVHLQKCYDQFAGIAKRHKEMVEEFYFVNPEYAQAHWERCMFWVEKSERVHGKLREHSEYLSRVLRAKYGKDERSKHERASDSGAGFQRPGKREVDPLHD